MKSSLKKRISVAVRQARVALGMTQEDAAEQIRISVEFYARIERANALPSLQTLVRMAMVFQTSTDKLLGLAEPESAQRIFKEVAARYQPKYSRELRRLLRKLRNSKTSRVRFLQVVNNEIEKLLAEESRESDDDSDDFDLDDSGEHDEEDELLDEEDEVEDEEAPEDEEGDDEDDGGGVVH